MEPLPRDATRTFGEVLLIVLAHLGRDPGDVVSPACQDAAYDSVSATGSCHRLKTHFAKDLFNRFHIRTALARLKKGKADSTSLDARRNPRIPECVGSNDRSG